jgi:hypothetical protein
VLFEVKDNEEAIDDVKFGPNARYVCTGSHDNWIDIYHIEGHHSTWRRTGRCQGHSSWISHLDWSVDGTVIQSNDAAYEMLYWRVDGKQETVNQRDTPWATWTCTLGFNVMGMWQDGMDGTDINAVRCADEPARLLSNGRQRGRKGCVALVADPTSRALTTGGPLEQRRRPRRRQPLSRRRG